MSQSDQEKNITRLFGSVLKEALEPSGFQVSVVQIPMVIPPDADVITCRRGDVSLSPVVHDMLQADGLRDDASPHVMINFHNVGELNEFAFQETLAYAYVYRTERALNRNDLRSFLVVTNKLETDILKKMVFAQTAKNGVYSSHEPLADSITVIVLDELAPEPHNAMLKSLFKA